METHKEQWLKIHVHFFFLCRRSGWRGSEKDKEAKWGRFR